MQEQSASSRTPKQRADACWKKKHKNGSCGISISESANVFSARRSLKPRMSVVLRNSIDWFDLPTVRLCHKDLTQVEESF
jgi:hypothetical protein